MTDVRSMEKFVERVMDAKVIHFSKKGLLHCPIDGGILQLIGGYFFHGHDGEYYDCPVCGKTYEFRPEYK